MRAISWFASSELPLTGLGQLGAVGGVLAMLLTFMLWVIKQNRDDCKEAAAAVKAEHELELKELRDAHQRALEHERTEKAAVQARLDAKEAAYDRLNELVREKYVDGLANAYHATTEAHDVINIMRDEMRRTPR